MPPFVPRHGGWRPAAMLIATIGVTCLSVLSPLSDSVVQAQSTGRGLAGRVARARGDVPETPRLPPGPYRIVARHSGKCVTLRDPSSSSRVDLFQLTCSGSENQHWRLEWMAGGYYRLRLNQGAAGALTLITRTTRLVQRKTTFASAQQWQLRPVDSGFYQLVARSGGNGLEVRDASLDDNAVVSLGRIADGHHQQWELRAINAPAPAPPPARVRPSVADTVRFLEQSTNGPTMALVERVRDIGFEAFLEEQFNATPTGYPTLPLFPTTRDTTTCNAICARDNYTMYPLQNRFFVNALYGEDQLRQRVAFALHQIIVVSGVDITQPSWMTPYLQILHRHAFGDYRQLLHDITLNAAMGNYLDVNGNTRTRPNENYARELLQLFSLGTIRLNPDGTPQLGPDGQPVPAYTQETINNFARVFTGWRFAAAPAPGVPNYLDPMVADATQHDTQTKTLLNGRVLPANQTAAKDLSDALDNIMDDPNVGPFIAKQLIQHLVTSNPSPAYVARVAAVFNGSTGPLGDLRATVRAILLDTEARGDVKTDASYGRLRHPAQYAANILRAFNARSVDGTTQSDGYVNPQLINMGMDLFRPPSVFSYFSPSGVVPGTAGVRGPEFGLYSTSTALRRINFVNTMAFSRIAVGTNSPAGTALDLAPWQALAGDPANLVNQLDTLLLHGTMSPEMRTGIVSAVTAVAASNTLKRAATAVYLVVSSSQYQVEK